MSSISAFESPGKARCHRAAYVPYMFHMYHSDQDGHIHLLADKCHIARLEIVSI